MMAAMQTHARALRRSFGWLALLAMTSAPFACGSGVIVDSCLDWCDSGNICSRSSFGRSGLSCAEMCDKVDALADAADCVDEFEAIFECAADAPDPCKVDASCSAELPGYAACIIGYSTEPMPDECVGLICTYQGSGISPSCSVSGSCGGPTYSLECDAEGCSCATDGTVNGDVAFDEAFCGELEAAVDAAAIACDWAL